MIKMGVICPSDIAYRRFMPAIMQIPNVEFAGLAINSPEERYGAELPSKEEVQSMLKRGQQKANDFVSQYGGVVFHSFEDLINSDNIDAIYFPLPPALHYRWVLEALKKGKHVLIEKPITTALNDTKNLLLYAMNHKLALHENYPFVFHNQVSRVNELINLGVIGNVWQYKISFGFPRRSQDDFRYNKDLGGGALLDAGGYTIKYAALLLGNSATIKYAHLQYTNEFNVDLFGTGILVNDEGITAQVSFGMDNEYKCELEVWGSKGSLRTGRILTTPVGFTPTAIITTGSKEKAIALPADDTFKKSVIHFINCIEDEETRLENYQRIEKHSELIDTFIKMAALEATKASI